MANVTRTDWAKAFLTKLGKPVNPDTTEAYVAWQCGENTKAEWNPIATTEPGEPGETEFNSAGVKDYPTMDEGLDASVRTILLPEYAAILALTADGASADRICAAIERSPWGTHDAVAALAELRANPGLGDVVVGDDGTEAPPAEHEPAAPPAPAVEVPVTLSELSANPNGKPSEQVATLQVLLNARTQAGLSVDGIFGPLTEAAVKTFQSRSALTVDGIVGPHTWTKLLGA